MASTAEMKSHLLTMEDRNRLSMTGAVNVDNFEETNMSIETVMGELFLKGSKMHIIKFDTQAGELVIEGDFDSMEYTDNSGRKGGFLSKLFG